MDLIDLFNGAGNPGKSGKSSQKAPIELVSQFLILISSENYQEAEVLCRQILEFEPENKLINDYYKSLQQLNEQRRSDEFKEGDDTSDNSSEENSDDTESEDSDDTSKSSNVWTDEDEDGNIQTHDFLESNERLNRK